MRRISEVSVLLLCLVCLALGIGVGEERKPEPANAPADFKKPGNWSAYDAGSVGGLSTKGFFGAVSDGRYVYFVPCREGSSFHGRVLRYDTKVDFKTASSWSAYDAGATDGLNTKGYAGAVFDGRYVYFVPFTDNSSRHARVLRYDTKADFATASSWSAYDAGRTDGIPALGFVDGIFDGRYIYLSPFGYKPFAHGRVVRYDTRDDFKKPSSWNVYDAGRTDGMDTRGFYGAGFDGRHVYFVPFNDARDFHGRVLRYDTKGEFKAAGSWSAYDAGKTDGLSTKGYKMAVFDGRHMYFVPFRDDESRHGRVLKYDTKGDFKAASSWSAYDAGATDGIETSGYVGAAFDKRFIYFIPYGEEGNQFHARVLRYDTQGGFKEAKSWSGYDAKSTDGLTTKGYKGSATDGRYIYYVPYHNG
ncbi:MAG: hypothetical protein RDV41_05830, partial [Planctomycetota bacterium]|nr:hypothetical protein [Planctomycetota bacterium]